MQQEKGSITGRRPIQHIGRWVNSDELVEVNSLIGALWDAGEITNFWVLNCLVVAGVRIIQELGTNARSAEIWRMPSNREILELRKRIGWLTCEIDRH